MEPHLVCVGKQIVSTFAVLKNLQKLGKLEKMPKLNHFKCAAYRYFYPGNLLSCIISDKLTILQCIIKWTSTWFQWLYCHYLIFDVGINMDMYIICSKYGIGQVYYRLYRKNNLKWVLIKHWRTRANLMLTMSW